MGRGTRGITEEEIYAQLVGAKLRRARQNLGVSLADVEEDSGGAWKAVVVSSYERGDRHPTVARLASLASWYGVDVRDLLPDQASESAPTTPVEEAAQLMRRALELLAAADRAEVGA